MLIVIVSSLMMRVLRQLKDLPRLHTVSRRYSSVLARPTVQRGTLAGNDYHYEEANRNFRWNIPEDWNFTADVIDKLAGSAEDR